MNKILFLPDAGPKNPFQYLLIDFLKKNGMVVVKAPSKRFLATVSAVSQHQPDIIYYDWIQSFILGKTFIITLLKMLSFWLEIQYIRRVKKIIIVHTLHNLQNHAGRWLFMERVIYGFFLRKCHRIRVYSAITKQKVSKLFKLNPDKIMVVQDIPYHYYYPNKASRIESRTYLRLKSHQFVYMFLGAIKPYKGLESLVTVFKKVKTAEDILLIAGSSDTKLYGQNIAQLIDNDPQIIFHNTFIEEEHIQYYFNAADVVVLPFRNVEHSGSVDLAMSFKKPVITLKTDFLSELLNHQEFLLFNRSGELEEKMQHIKQVNGIDIGQKNYQLADNSNYRSFISFFTADLS